MRRDNAPGRPDATTSRQAGADAAAHIPSISPRRNPNRKIKMIKIRRQCRKKNTSEMPLEDTAGKSHRRKLLENAPEIPPGKATGESHRKMPQEIPPEKTTGETWLENTANSISVAKTCRENMPGKCRRGNSPLKCCREIPSGKAAGELDRKNPPGECRRQNVVGKTCRGVAVGENVLGKFICKTRGGAGIFAAAPKAATVDNRRSGCYNEL